MKNILIVVAMESEAREVIKELNLVNEFPFLVYEGNIKNKYITLIISKVGKTNASSALTYGLLNKKDIDLIINFGIVGGVNVDLNELYFIKDAKYDDVDATLFDYKLGQIPGFPEFYQSDLNYNKLNFKSISLYTSDSFVTKIKRKEPYLVDMEGASLYQVAYRFNKPIISFKLVSDLIENEDQKSHYEKTTINMPEILKINLINLLEVI